MAHKEIKTSIVIQASPEKVWSILTNTEEYPNWNPFIKSFEGQIKVGNTVKINAGGMNFKPTILKFEKNKELRWIGRLLFKGIFDGEHSFQIEDNGDGTVTFKHEEIFNGILVGPFSKKLDKDTKTGFEDMNRILKEKAEKL